MVNRPSQVMALAAACALAGVVGCSEQSERINAPPQGMSERQNEMHEHFSHMTDNAIQLDSSIADCHFEPHVAELSGLGVWRITRMGEVLSPTGGIIRYETSLDDEDLLAARLQSVRDFLGASGFDTDRITIEAGLARNAGGHAAVAIEARHRGMTAQTSTSSGAGQSGAPMGPP